MKVIIFFKWKRNRKNKAAIERKILHKNMGGKRVIRKKKLSEIGEPVMGVVGS